MRTTVVQGLRENVVLPLFAATREEIGAPEMTAAEVAMLVGTAWPVHAPLQDGTVTPARTRR